MRIHLVGKMHTSSDISHTLPPTDECSSRPPRAEPNRGKAHQGRGFSTASGECDAAQVASSPSEAVEVAVGVGR